VFLKGEVEKFITNSNHSRLMTKVIELFTVWNKHYDIKFRKEFVSLLLKVREKYHKLREPFYLENPFMFQELYFHFIRIAINTQQNK
jgi:hypothetical protein